MTLNHVITIAIGAALIATGALTGTSAVLAPVGSTIIGGVLGHANQPNKTP